MRARLEQVRLAWQGIPLRHRHAIGALFALLVTTVLALAWLRIGAERPRLRTAVAVAEARGALLRDAIAEVQRLRAQPVSGASGIVAETIQTTLRGRGLDLAVKNEGGDRWHVQGSADFDRLVEALAALQRDDKLRLLSLTVKRDSGGAHVDAQLGVSPP
jgi:type II secretory pathway component PulM